MSAGALRSSDTRRKQIRREGRRASTRLVPVVNQSMRDCRTDVTALACEAVLLVNIGELAAARPQAPPDSVSVNRGMSVHWRRRPMVLIMQPACPPVSA